MTVTLRKQGTCDRCKAPLYGNDYGPGGHSCPMEPPSSQEILDRLKQWLSAFDITKESLANVPYMKGWHDCIDDVLRKIEEFEKANNE